MKKYKVTFNFTKVYDAIKPYKLRQYKPIPTFNKKKERVYLSEIKITGKSPDDVCFTSMRDFLSLLRDQQVPEGIVQDVKYTASIKSVEELDE